MQYVDLLKTCTVLQPNDQLRLNSFLAGVVETPGIVKRLPQAAESVPVWGSRCCLMTGEEAPPIIDYQIQIPKAPKTLSPISKKDICMDYLFVGHGSFERFTSEMNANGINELFLEVVQFTHPSTDPDRFIYEHVLWIQGIEKDKNLVHYCAIQLNYDDLLWDDRSIDGLSKKEVKAKFLRRRESGLRCVEVFLINIGFKCRSGLISFPQNLITTRALQDPMKLDKERDCFVIEY